MTDENQRFSGKGFQELMAKVKKTDEDLGKKSNDKKHTPTKLGCQETTVWYQVTL